MLADGKYRTHAHPEHFHVDVGDHTEAGTIAYGNPLTVTIHVTEGARGGDLLLLQSSHAATEARLPGRDSLTDRRGNVRY